MEIEYSQEVRGKVFAYRFLEWEMNAIAEGLKHSVRKREKMIERIRNSPKNEGQAKYSVQIDHLTMEVRILNQTIEEFSK